MTKSLAEKRLRDLQPYRDNPREPKSKRDLKTMPPPESLTPEARAVWDKYMEEIPRGMLTALDYMLFARFCMFSADYLQISGNSAADRALRLSLSRELRSLEDRLGLTPVTRQKVVCETGDEDNPFAGL